MGKNSYIYRLFFTLSILLVSITMIMSMSIYRYSKKAVSNEIIDLNKAVLGQISENVNWTIDDSINLCNKIADNNMLMEILRLNTINHEKQEIIKELIEEITTNYIWSSNRQKRLLEVYVLGFNGANYASSSQKFSISDSYYKFKHYNLYNDNGRAILINSPPNYDEKGLYKYTFQVVREIRDHITQETYGFVILNISENALYGSYKDLVKDNRKVFIIDEDFNILSSANKLSIGEKYLKADIFLDNPLKQNGVVMKEDRIDTSMIFFDRIKGTSWYLIEEISMEEIWKPLERIKTFIFFITIMCIILLILLSKYFANKISKPIVEIRNSMEQVTQGNLNTRANINSDDEFGYIANSFNEMVIQIEHLLNKVKTEERNKRIAELDFLRAQINPHFIYNTLSSIRFYIDMDKNKEAEEMLYYFSKILRNSLSRTDEFITLDEELKTIKDYVKLQKLRYTDGFDVIYDISEEILDAMVPTFILQPIVENSIFYSIGKKDTGLIKIIGRKEKDKIKIIIADNGIGMNEEEINRAFNKEVQVNKVGLINVHERIQLNYGSEYGLNIISENDKGTQVIFILPYNKR